MPPTGPGTGSNGNQKVYKHIEQRHPIGGEHPYVYLDRICLKRSWSGEVKNASVLVASGVNADGYQEIPGTAEDKKKNKACKKGFCAT